MLSLLRYGRGKARATIYYKLLDDNFIYEIAFAASPCTIVSHNVRDFAAPELRWPGVMVKTPQLVLREVRLDA